MIEHMLAQYGSLPLPVDLLRAQLEKWISMQESWCSDKSFSARFPWRETGLPQNAFLQQKLCINGKYFLTGPRYKAGDISRPFIDIVASDSVVDNPVLDVISKAWARIKPEYIRVLVPGCHTPAGIADQLIYSTPLDFVSAPQDERALSLIRAVPADFAWCKYSLIEAYEHAWSAIPGLAGSLCATESGELQQHILNGDTWILFEQGKRVGLIICEKADTAFLPGFRISEEIILPAFRGRSLASRAQRMLCRYLFQNSQPTSLLSGTISPQNLPSVKSAEKAGRTCILSYQFLPAKLSSNERERCVPPDMFPDN
ncbi:GNAT family N-acetyltransferase [Pantoea piersonii]|uniref:GNAT family N-acetyltransferase n=1 Tax=Pantoea piersonii TaxID=2364647 RepID=UPI0028A00C60|nr:hypothetical protein [Pantoea piersonii]